MCKAVKVIVRNYLGEKLLLFFDRPYHELHNLHCTSSHQSREQEIGMVLRCCLIPGLWDGIFTNSLTRGLSMGFPPFVYLIPLCQDTCRLFICFKKE